MSFRDLEQQHSLKPMQRCCAKALYNHITNMIENHQVENGLQILEILSLNPIFHMYTPEYRVRVRDVATGREYVTSYYTSVSLQC